ncbi:MAG TPA: 16S rRNA (cytidine(1402)-2'-O)-methyltransferase [Actinomycetota bacterium]|nr:16S rRNA (cytidine(1402)-2'-O)-methyltransferase [Actinomycetota bacterium]
MVGPGMSGVLYLVGTPIGNLGDLSDRARDTLAAVTVVAAEDTRRTGRLLRSLDIRTPLVSMFEGNEDERAAELVERLDAGDDVAVVTDGGMPSVSDPGYRVVRRAVERGIEVRAVPGPSAAIAALVLSGLPTDRFAFEGFLPRRAGDRGRRLQALLHDPRTIVFFESPRRVRALLREVGAVMGDRRVAVCRELTKLHEEVIRGTVAEVLTTIEEREPKGEVTVVVEGDHEGAPLDRAALLEEVRRLTAEGMRPRDAARSVAERHGASANDLYRAAIASD